MEAIHWIFEILEEWNVTHYLDNVLFIFPQDMDITEISVEFDRILSIMDLSKAMEKDSGACVVVHLGLEFDSINIQVTLPPNKKQHALDAVDSLLSADIVTNTARESTIHFLSHYYQVIPLDHPFLRQLISLLCRCSEGRHFRKIRILQTAKEDLL